MIRRPKNLLKLPKILIEVNKDKNLEEVKRLTSCAITSVSSANGALIIKVLSSGSDDLRFIKVPWLMMRDRCGLVTPKSVSFCVASADLRGCRPALCGKMLISGTERLRFPCSPVIPLTEFCVLRDNTSCELLSLETAWDELEDPWPRSLDLDR